MLIDDLTLRAYLIEVLKTRTRNQIVKEIKSNNQKFHQYNIDRFMQGKDVSIETAKKLDDYVQRVLVNEYIYPFN